MITTVTQEDVINNVTIITDLIESHVSEPNKSALLKALDGNFGTLYFSAPASGNKNYHLPVSGGLAAHSLNVLSSMKKLNDAFNMKFSEEDMVLVCLLHDI